MDGTKCTCGKKNCDCDKKFDSQELTHCDGSNCNSDVRIDANKGNKIGDYTVTISGYLDNFVMKNMTKEIVNWSLKMKEMEKNPYIPKVIYSDPDMLTTIVEWEDGTKTKVKCDSMDTYSWEGGYYAALAIKVLADGKKADMKNKWLPVLSRRVKEISSDTSAFEKIIPFPYGKWKDEQKARKEIKKLKKATKEAVKNDKDTKKAKGSKGQ